MLKMTVIAFFQTTETPQFTEYFCPGLISTQKFLRFCVDFYIWKKSKNMEHIEHDVCLVDHFHFHISRANFDLVFLKTASMAHRAQSLLNLNSIKIRLNVHTLSGNNEISTISIAFWLSDWQILERSRTKLQKIPNPTPSKQNNVMLKS